MPSVSQFDQVITIDNLRVAWIKASHYAETEELYFDAHAYEAFKQFLEAKLLVLQEELVNGTYEPEPFRFLAIPRRWTRSIRL